MTIRRSHRWPDSNTAGWLGRAALVAALALPLSACNIAGCCDDVCACEEDDDAGDDDGTIPGDTGEDLDAAKPLNESYVPDEYAPVLTYMLLSRLLDPILVDDPEMLLLRAFEYLNAHYEAHTFLVGVEPGYTGEGPAFWLDPYWTEPFYGPQVETDAEGMYTVVEFAVLGEDCGTTGIDPEVVDEQGDQPARRQGICAPLSVLHSLVDQMYVVPEDWEGVVDGDDWGSEMLGAVITAGGRDPDDPQGRAFSADSGDYDRAHSEAWNADFDIVSKTGGQWIAEERDDCASLKLWCEQMEVFVEEHNDDCILRVNGGTIDGREVGHAMTVYNTHGADAGSTVGYAETDTSCYCDIKVVDTSRQDDAGDLVVPRDPGHQLWRIYPDDVVVAASDNANAAFFTGARFQQVSFQCWDEDPKEGVTEDDEGRPGDAMPIH